MTTSSERAPRVGVLALHGGVAEHGSALAAVGAEPVPVRDAASLGRLDGLILPGGESTTVRLLAGRDGLLSALRERIADGLPTFGTCAGLIALASRIDGADVPLLGGLDVTVRRNAYGCQRASFEASIAVPALGEPTMVGVFIRAPQITECGAEVEVLARHAGVPVAVRQRSVWAAAFHPELTDDRRLHRAFVDGAVRGSGESVAIDMSKGENGVRA